MSPAKRRADSSGEGCELPTIPVTVNRGCSPEEETAKKMTVKAEEKKKRV